MSHHHCSARQNLKISVRPCSHSNHFTLVDRRVSQKFILSDCPSWLASIMIHHDPSWIIMNPQKLVVNHHDHHFNHEFCQLVEIIMGFQSKSWDSTNSTVELPFSAQARLGWCLARSRRGATLDLIFDRWYRVSSGNRKKMVIFQISAL